MNKKQLYESIMRQVSKEVKKVLNENNMQDDKLHDIFYYNLRNLIIDGGLLNSAEEERASKSLANEIFNNIEYILEQPDEVIGSIIKQAISAGKDEFIKTYGESEYIERTYPEYQ